MARLLASIAARLSALPGRRVGSSGETPDVPSQPAAEMEHLRHADEDGRRAEAIVAALVQRAPGGIMLLDRNLRIEAANSEAIRLLDMAQVEPLGVPISDALLGNDLIPLLQRALTTDEDVRADLRRIGPGGGSIAVQVVAIRNEGGPDTASGAADAHPIGLLVLAEDLTNRLRLEALRKDFVANVSHELRTPMASIRAMAETLRDGALQDPKVASHFLDTILKEADRLTRISADLLTLSDAETKPPELTPVSLTELCHRIVRRVAPQADKAGLTIQPDVRDGVVVMADEDQMEQVVLNLMDNAIKYTPEGGSVRISLDLEGAPDTDRMSAVLVVTDTGIGILQEHLPRVFERFYRVDKARSRQSGGTGLGLSIVKNIVESHGGSVSVQSEYTRGSAFTVRLPYAPSPPARRNGISAEPDRL